MNFTERVASLPEVRAVSRLELQGPRGQRENIENRPGSMGSVRIYAYLAGKYGQIDVDAAREGVELYAEHGEDARRHAGRHPNIDRLFAILAGGGTWRLCIVPETA
ncbi:MAG TPA: DUF2322 family protein [Thiobacillaceae bacterium]|nr:DUF2322 family protein [Thiobacillaceae bacterium]HNU62919.1 DUF2322 family protein [Thiobacillaceae bacterium]